MSKLAALAPLRDLLVDLYPTRDGSYRLVDEAGLRRAHIAFENAAIDNWQNILVEAHRRSRVGAVVAIAQGEYPEQAEALQASLQAYEGAEETAEDRPSTAGWWPWAIAGAFAAAAVLLGWLWMRGPVERPEEPSALCVLPDISLLNRFDRSFALRFSTGPGSPTVSRDDPPLGALCLTHSDSEESLDRIRQGWGMEALQACVEVSEQQWGKVPAEEWGQAPEFISAPRLLDLDRVYVEVLRNNAVVYEGFSQPRATESPSMRLTCLVHDLQKGP